MNSISNPDTIFTIALGLFIVGTIFFILFLNVGHHHHHRKKTIRKILLWSSLSSLFVGMSMFFCWLLFITPVMSPP